MVRNMHACILHVHPILLTLLKSKGHGRNLLCSLVTQCLCTTTPPAWPLEVLEEARSGKRVAEHPSHPLVRVRLLNRQVPTVLAHCLAQHLHTRQAFRLSQCTF